jgi:hypothetical protein
MGQAKVFIGKTKKKRKEDGQTWLRGLFLKVLTRSFQRYK